MAYIRKNLNNRRGASILIAMILLLVASMVSIVIVSASLTATHRAKSERDYTQQTLYVQSAAELLKECLKNTTVTISQTVYEYENNDIEEGGVAYSFSGDGLSNVIGSVICNAVQEVEGFDSLKETEDKTITIAAGEDAPEATVTFHMYNKDNKDSDDNIVRFADAETATNPSYLYTMIGDIVLREGDSVKMSFVAYASGNYSNRKNESSISKLVGDDEIEGTKYDRVLEMKGWNVSLYTFAAARGGD